MSSSDSKNSGSESTGCPCCVLAEHASSSETLPKHIPTYYNLLGGSIMKPNYPDRWNHFSRNEYENPNTAIRAQLNHFFERPVDHSSTSFQTEQFFGDSFYVSSETQCGNHSRTDIKSGEPRETCQSSECLRLHASVSQFLHCVSPNTCSNLPIHCSNANCTPSWFP